MGQYKYPKDANGIT